MVGAVNAQAGLQSYRPTAYLDQWVWIRMARAASGKPDDPCDPKLLEALIGAADAGVAFPLSCTHYIETGAIRNPRQRRDVAAVMASVSHCRTIRLRREHSAISSSLRCMSNSVAPPSARRTLIRLE